MTTIIILSIIFLVIDQISKILIIKLLEPNEVITIIKNFFYIIYTNNTGAAFSILLGKRIFLIVVAILIIGILLYYIKKNKVDGKTIYQIEIDNTEKIEEVVKNELEKIDKNNINVYATKQESPEIVEKLVQNKIKVYKVCEQDISLETAFLKKTGGNVIE